jgi:PBP1b-binding outer membrane lipoprotein LpoB
MKYTLLVTLALLLGGCSSSSTATKLPVKIISEKMADECNYLGSVSGSEIMSLTVDRNVALARLNAAEEAVALGANSAVITDSEVTANGNSATVMMDAYICN